MRAVFSGFQRAVGTSSRTVVLSPSDIDESAAPGTVVGRLSVAGASGGWTFRLADAAGASFALSGADIVVGASALSTDTRPAPKLLVVATDGLRSVAGVVTVNVRRALRSIPLAAGARIAAVGDGQIAINNAAGPTDTSTSLARAASGSAYGFVEQARALDPRFNFDTWYDAADPAGRSLSGASQGIFGDRLSSLDSGGGLLARLPALLARRPDLLILGCGSETIDAGESAETCIALTDKALALCRNAGVGVVAMTIPPRGDWPQGDARLGVRTAVNAWIRLQATRGGVVAILDPETLLAPAGVLDATLYDAGGVYPNHRGGYRIARERFLPILQAAVQSGSTFVQDPAVSNLIGAVQGQMQGTAGVRTGAAVTGNLATGLQLAIVGNASAVQCAKETVSGAIERQIVDIVPSALTSATHGQVTLTLPAVSSSVPAAGQWVTASLFVETDAVAALSFARLTLQAERTGMIVAQGSVLGGSAIDYATALPSGVKGFWLSTQPLQVPSGGATALRWFLDVFFPRGAAAFRLKMSRPILRVIADPRPAWFFGLGAALAISGTPGPATLGRSYSFVPVVTGGSGTRRFGLSGFLPAGLSFSAATGAISGTPTEIANVGGIVLSVADDTGTAVLSDLVIAVASQGASGPFAGMQYLLGADSARLLGADSARLLGKVA